MTDPQTQNPSRTWMRLVGAIALVVGALVAWNGYRNAMSAQSVYDNVAPESGLHADFAWMWVGIALGAVGVILLFTAWVISAARK